MKTFGTRLRCAAAIAVIAALGACGGYTTVDLGGTIAGLTVDGLVLANDGNTLAVPANSTTYTFPEQIDSRGTYDVTVQANPPHYSCAVVGGKGAATGIDVTTANVVCDINRYTIGGTIAGLSTTGLVLTNGSDTLTVDAGTSSFVMPARVAYGAVYGVAVLTQPTGQTCTVSNGTAVMGEANVTNIQVTCG